MSPSEYYVREVATGDLKFAQQATDVINAAYNTHDGWTTEASIVSGHFTLEDTQNFIKHSHQGEFIQLLVFKRDKEGNDAEVVGSLLIVPFPDLEEKPTPGEAMITRFAISPSHQSKGLGRLLIESSLKSMKSAGYERCSLRVFENRPEVLSWYSKLGFKDTSERRDFKVPLGKQLLSNVQFVIMKKDL
ncbi:acetyltransferase [Mucor ambiguus]|uniref:Acetyltransferase n=1 Tax=Mucor ambiguus TaxID=91626 RepID=A0A0C9MZX7_9FUNG|nr:acetyltransferase [Mucor ambiguus]